MTLVMAAVVFGLTMFSRMELRPAPLHSRKTSVPAGRKPVAGIIISYERKLPRREAATRGLTRKVRAIYCWPSTA